MDERGTINVLYVDDQKDNLVSFTASFRRTFNIFTAISAQEAEKIMSKNTIHVLITDQKMPVKTGTELLAETVKKYPSQTRILLTAFADIQVLIDAVNEGKIYMYIEKPWNHEALECCIKEGYLEFYHKQNSNQDTSKVNKKHKKFKSMFCKKRR